MGVVNDVVDVMLLRFEVNRRSGSRDMVVVRWQQRIACFLHDVHY